MKVQPLFNEAGLLESMKEGSSDAFTELYLHYSPLMYVVILRMVKDPETAQEIVQELFSGIWQKRTVLDFENFSGYLYRASQHKVINFFKKLQQDREHLQHFRKYAGAHYSHIEEALHFRESSAMLHKVLADLTPQQRRVYELCKIEGQSYKEAAAILGISPLTVKEYLVSANKKIRLYFDENAGSSLSLLLLYELRNMFF